MFNSIKWRLGIVLAATSIVPLLCLSFLSYVYFNNVWVRNNKVDLAYLNQQTTNAINAHFLKAVDQVFSWQERPMWAEGLRKEGAGLANFTDQVAHETHLIDSLFVLDRAGKVVATNREDKEGTINPFRYAAGFNFPFYNEISHEEVSISAWREVRIGDAVSQTVVLSFPVISRGTYLGMVVALLNQSQIHATMESERDELIKRGFTSGLVVVVGRETGTVYNMVGPDKQGIASLHLKDPSHEGKIVTFAGAPWYAFAETTSFGDNELVIGSLISESNLLQATHRILNLSLLADAAMLVLLIFVVAFLTRTLAHPVAQLTTQAEAFGAGDYASEIKVTSKDEIGRLALVLEQTRKNVSSYIKALTLANEEQERMALSFARFVPVEFLHSLGKVSVLDIHVGDTVSQDITVFFSDIRNFTAMSETLPADVLFGFLNSLFAEITPPIHAHHGFIDKFIGDAIMALFTKCPDDALRASIAVRQRLAHFNTTHLPPGIGVVDIGIGLNTGNLMLGTVGSDDRIDTTVIGDTVNLASRVETATKHYGVHTIISGSTHDKLLDRSVFLLRDIDNVRVKGKQQPVRFYELFDADPPAIMEIKKRDLALFQDAMQGFRAGKFVDARAKFQRCLDACPQDAIAALYVSRCLVFEKEPPRADWDGVTVLTEK